MKTSMENIELAGQVEILLRKFSQDPVRSGKISIPGGAVRRVDEISPQYEFVRDERLRKNICFAIEFLDYMRWQREVFKVYGPVSSYLFKTGIVYCWMIAEAIAQDFIKQRGRVVCGKTTKRIDQLRRLGIPDEVCNGVKALHERRANIHLSQVSDLENEKYTERDWNHAFRAMEGLRDAIMTLADKSSASA